MFPGQSPTPPAPRLIVNIVPIVPPVLLVMMVMAGVVIVVVRHHQVLVVETAGSSGGAGVFVGAAVGRRVDDEGTSGTETTGVQRRRVRGQHAAQGVFSDGVRHAGVLTGGQPGGIRTGHGRRGRVGTGKAGRVLLGL